MKTNTLTRWLTSPRVVIALLSWIAAFCVIATLIPQGSPQSSTVVAWAATHRTAEAIVVLLGLHSAFSSIFFVVPMTVLAASTGVCSWRRTKAALSRWRAVRATTASELGSTRRVGSVVRAEGDANELVDIAESVMRKARLRVDRDGLSASGVARAWGAFGSPVFHWAVFALIVVIALGELSAASGLMGVPVGQAKPIVPESFGVLTVGPLHSWGASPLSIKVADLDTTWVVDGLDRGVTPLVEVTRADGAVLASGRVFPNNPLRHGTVTVHPNDFGLATSFTLMSARGAKAGDVTLLVDFDAASRTGTTESAFDLTGAEGAAAYEATASVLIPRRGGEVAGTLPAEPRVRVRLASVNGAKSYSVTRDLAPGESIALPGGGDLKLDKVTYYARLSVVDDWSWPYVYVLLAVGLLGISVSILAAPQVALVQAVSRPDGRVDISVWASAWRTDKGLQRSLAAGIAEETSGIVEEAEGE